MRRTRIGLVQLDDLHLERHDLIAAVVRLELALHLHDGVFLDGLGVVVVLEADALHVARRILQGECGHLRAALRQLRHHVRDHAHEHRGLDLLRALGQVSQRELGHTRDGALVRAQRVVRDVDLHDLLLERQQLALRPLHAVRFRNLLLEARIGIVAEQVEHRHLAALTILLALRGAFQQRRLVNEVHELLARVARRVERPALDERFQRLAVVAFRVQAVHEVVQRRERPVRLALLDDGLGHVRAHAAHAHQAEAHALVGGRELGVGRIDVRRQHGNARVVAACDVADQTVGVAHVGRQHGRHEVVRVVRLQVRRAHDQDGVGGRVRFVERVLSEFLRVFPDLLRDFQRIAVLHRAGVPVFLQRAHDVELLLAHSLAQLVGLARRETAHSHGYLHDLLLVDHGAVRLLQDGAEALVVVVDGGLAAGHLDVVLDHAGFQRARTVESDRGDDVGEARGRQAREQADVQRALHLEQAVHVAGLHELEGALVVDGDVLGNHLRAEALLDVAARDGEHVERAQAEEVHFQQTQLGRVMAVVLGDDAAALGVALHGHVIGHGVAADDGGARVHTLAAHVAFDGQRGVDDGLHVLFGLVGLLEIGVRGQRLVDGDAQLVADHLRDLVAGAIRVVQHARGVAHGVLGLQGAERDDLRHVVLAVHVLDVVDHFFATALLEVDVDIGHLHALGRQESLEQQAVGQRVERSDVHGVRHDGACGRTTARTHADALAARPFDVLLHDEEVRREALLDDDAHLVVGALLRLLRNGIAVVLDQALLHALAEVAFLGLALGQRETRKDGVALQHHVHLLGHFHRGVAGLGEVLEGLAHLLLGLHVELVVLEAHAVGVVERRARADAQHVVLGARVLAREVVEVVRGDGLEAGGLGHVGQHVVELGLREPGIGADALVLQLDVEIARFEAAGELLGPFDRLVYLAVVEQLRNDAGDASRRADDALAVLLQHAEGGARLVVEVVHVRLADQLHQVVVALVRLGQQQQVVQLRLRVLAQLFVGGEVHLAAVDGLHALARLGFHLVAHLAQLRNARHHAVIGDGHRGHVEVGGSLHHVVDMSVAVEQGIFGMVVQVDECHILCLLSVMDARRGIDDILTAFVVKRRLQTANKRWFLRERRPQQQAAFAALDPPLTRRPI